MALNKHLNLECHWLEVVWTPRKRLVLLGNKQYDCHGGISWLTVGKMS